VLPEWLILGFIFGGVFSVRERTVEVGLGECSRRGHLPLSAAGAGGVPLGAPERPAPVFAGSLFAYGALALLCAAMIGFALLAITGLFDSFFDFRHFNRKDSSHEGHSD